MATFTLIDDGSLDTVVACDNCGEEIRFTSATLLEGVRSTNEKVLDEARIENALALAEDEHKCEEDKT